MAVTITLSKIAALNTIAAVTSCPATADTDALAEVFTVTPTKAGGKMLFIIGGTGSGADDNITFSISAGGFSGAKIISGTVTKNTEKMIQIDTARVKQTDGTIAITLTPAATDKLVTNHAAYMKYIELL